MVSTSQPSGKTILDQVWESLQSGAKVYAVVDTAHDPTLYAEISELNEKLYLSLFRDTLLNKLDHVAPYLIQLDRRTKFPETFAEGSWGKGWGIFLESSASLEVLQQHLQKLLLVKDENGRFLHFRFYDPRVLRVYLPTCTADELTQVFGEISRFSLQGKGNNEMVHYSIKDSKLLAKSVQINPASSA